MSNLKSISFRQNKAEKLANEIKAFAKSLRNLQESQISFDVIAELASLQEVVSEILPINL